MWDYILNISAVFLGTVLVLYVVRSIGEKKITEAQSLPWIISGFIIILLGIAPGIIGTLSDLLGIWYPPTIVYVIGIALLVFITLHHAVTISKLSNELNELAMIVSLLRYENEKMKDMMGKMMDKDVNESDDSVRLNADTYVVDTEKEML